MLKHIHSFLSCTVLSSLISLHDCWQHSLQFSSVPPFLVISLNRQFHLLHKVPLHFTHPEDFYAIFRWLAGCYCPNLLLNYAQHKLLNYGDTVTVDELSSAFVKEIVQTYLNGTMWSVCSHRALVLLSSNHLAQQISLCPPNWWLCKWDFTADPQTAPAKPHPSYPPQGRSRA